MELNRRLRRLEAAGFSEARCRRSVVTGGTGFFGESGVKLSWLERVPDKDEVLGSNPSTPTILWDLNAIGNVLPRLRTRENRGFRTACCLTIKENILKKICKKKLSTHGSVIVNQLLLRDK